MECEMKNGSEYQLLIRNLIVNANSRDPCNDIEKEKYVFCRFCLFVVTNWVTAINQFLFFSYGFFSTSRAPFFCDHV